MPDQSPIPVSVLTGFLGSGKTTLLNRLLGDPAMAGTAVIINEFGEVGIDHLLVEKADEGIMEMSSGCLCCTIRGDLIDTIAGLIEKRDAGQIRAFDRIVIETTGLADPAPVLHTIMNHPGLLVRTRLDGVVTTVDAVNGAGTLDAQEEAVKQAAVADRLVITKTDIADPARTEELRARLRALNPSAPQLTAAAGEATRDRLFEAGLYDPATKSPDVARWLCEEAFSDGGHGHGHHHHGHDVNRHDARISAFCVTQDAPVTAGDFELFMDLLRANHGADLLRMKGIVQIAEEPDRPVVIHGVQHVFHPPVRLDAWPGGDRRTRIVFITRDIPKTQIEGLLKAFSTPPSREDVLAAFGGDETLSVRPGGGLFGNDRAEG